MGCFRLHLDVEATKRPCCFMSLVGFSATFFGLLLTPVFYVVIRGRRTRLAGLSSDRSQNQVSTQLPTRAEV